MYKNLFFSVYSIRSIPIMLIGINGGYFPAICRVCFIISVITHSCIFASVNCNSRSDSNDVMWYSQYKRGERLIYNYGYLLNIISVVHQLTLLARLWKITGFSDKIARQWEINLEWFVSIKVFSNPIDLSWFRSEFEGKYSVPLENY